VSVNLTGFLGVVLLAYLIPGPDFLVVVRSAAQRPALGRAAALGAQTGLCVHVLAAALGLSVLAAQSAAVFTAVKLAGAAYLVYLGVRALLAARSASAPAPGGSGPGAAAVPSRTRRASFVEGFLTNVLNPKAALFFLSVLPQFIEHGSPSTTSQIFLLGALDVLVGVVYWAGLVSVAAKVRAFLDRPAVRRRWDRVTGCLFIGIGVGVATAD
jgi:threonine/homoserine/homoserine lactone efflux protein